MRLLRISRCARYDRIIYLNKNAHSANIMIATRAKREMHHHDDYHHTTTITITMPSCPNIVPLPFLRSENRCRVRYVCSAHGSARALDAHTR